MSGRPQPLLNLLVLVAVGLAAGACGPDQPATASPQRKSATPAPAQRAVKVEPAGERQVARTVIATGTLAAEDQVVLGFQVAGRLSEILVDLGSRVRRGQALARLDPTDFRLRVEQAEAALRQARVRVGLSPEGTDTRVNIEETAVVAQARAVLVEARLTRERMVKLWEQQLVARAQLDAAVAALQVAEARYQDAVEEVRNRQAVLAQRRSELELARQQLADTTLTSPIDGAARERRASVGQYLAAGTPVATVVQLDPLRLRVAVPERDAADVRPGQKVRLTVEGDSASYGGRVVRLSPAIEEQSRTLLVEAEIPNPRGALRPGAFAKAEITTDAGRPVVVVPASAIVTFAGIDKVLAVADGRAVEKRVQLGRRLGEHVEVVSGLDKGEAVVVQPGNLVGGQQVTVVPGAAR
ncbi:MAG TPA: efflux RND transporter periplasmic adaptor subunit [Methylomirabilota bacterium]|nr:efflux RND transporter periplasmic adaptor subunit [Methylomirabilota bacterium]